jgi:Cu2+-exporting ATPase
MNAIASDGFHTLWSDTKQGRARAVFAAAGIRCASCSRSIEKAIRALPGIDRVDVNVATARVAVDWDSTQTDLQQVLEAVERAGFHPAPLMGERAAAALVRERRAALKRIGLAGIGMMQVMMYVYGVYVARPDSIDPAIASYLRYVGLVITTPVLIYSGGPFFVGAWRDLRRRALGMDVPVALALALAYGASVFNTVRESGQTYFDSVTMFIFFLGVGRYVEMIVRQQSLSLSEAVARSLPARVARLKPDGSTERVLLENIVAGDAILVPKGAVIPVDATVAAAEASVDESLVTGESRPQTKHLGDSVPGGAVNVGSAIQVVALRDVSSSTLASIVALLERAQGARPQVTRVADRIANTFIAAILLIALGVAIAWWYVDPTRAFPAALAVLVVTCPCALSLATPVAVAAAATRLARSGLLVTRADALERLAQIDTVVLDKTGTLTVPQSSFVQADVSATLTEERALAIAAALERMSAHPLATAFTPYADARIVASDVVEHAGRGIEGKIDGIVWRLGKREFVSETVGSIGVSGSCDDLCLASTRHEEAVFRISEVLQPQAQQAIGALAELGVETRIASGDKEESVTDVARTLGIEHADSRLTPEDKTNRVRALQSEGHRVLMLGDGINDGPVLAAAHVSCAMGRGSAIAQAAADLLLLNDSLRVVADAIQAARRMGAIIRQNLGWALLYNGVAIPLAALDWVPPWLAAIGMSASSLLVVLNARRLARAAA